MLICSMQKMTAHVQHLNSILLCIDLGIDLPPFSCTARIEMMCTEIIHSPERRLVI